MTVANKMADKVQPFSTTLKTAFSIHVDQECEININASTGELICTGHGLRDSVFSCETEKAFKENKFTVEIFGTGIDNTTHGVEGTRDENFVYVVNKSIPVKMHVYEYTVNVTAEGLPECAGENTISFTLVNAETKEDILDSPVIMSACSESVQFNATMRTKVVVDTTTYSATHYLTEEPTFETGESMEVAVPMKFDNVKTLEVNLRPAVLSEKAKFNVSVKLANGSELAWQSNDELKFKFPLNVKQETDLVVRVTSEDYKTAEEEVTFSEKEAQDVQIDLELQRTLNIEIGGEYEEGDELTLIVRDTFGNVLATEKVTPDDLTNLELSGFDTYLYYVQLGDVLDVVETSGSAHRLRESAKYLPVKQVLNTQASNSSVGFSFTLVKAANTNLRQIAVNFASSAGVDESLELTKRVNGSVVTLKESTSNATLDEVIVEAGKSIVF